MKTEANKYFINFFTEYLPTLRGYVFSMEQGLGCVFRVLPLIDEIEEDGTSNYIVSIKQEYTPAYDMGKEQYLQY